MFSFKFFSMFIISTLIINSLNYFNVIFNTKTKAVEIRGVPYDVEATVKALKNSGLPEAFASRLQSGKEFALKNKQLTCEC